MTYISRDAWGAAAPTKTRPVSKMLKGVCLHWMGFEVHGDAKRLVLSIQNNHMDPPKGWWDVAYNELISQKGEVLEGRGLTTRSGAQGSTRHNKGYIALGLLIGPDQSPTPQMIEAVKERIAVVRFFQPHATEIVGHLDLKPTTCPGPEVYRLMKAGVFEPNAEVEQTLEQRVEALEADVKAINARL